MTSQVIGIYGASGFGREVLPIVRQQTVQSQPLIVFIDDDDGSNKKINGHTVHNWQSFLEISSPKSVAIAIADSLVRASLQKRCLQNGIKMFEVRSSNVFIGDDVTIASGAIIQPFVALTGNIVIGHGFHANIYSYVAHDCRIGDYVTFAPAVKCNGNVHIADGAYVGTGAILRQGTPEKPLYIGERAVIGMGAVVTKDVPAGVTVVGNPARILEK